MSRLDDELKLMFQREEPSADFTEQVLERINIQAQPKVSLWQRLISFFQPNMLRWAVAATAIFLIAVFGFVQYQRLHKNAVEQQLAGDGQAKPPESVASGITPEEKPDEGGRKYPENETTGIEQKQITSVGGRTVRQHRSQRLKYLKESSSKNEAAIAIQRKAEGEMAKEQLMKALFIASATVNEAKKLAIGDD